MCSGCGDVAAADVACVGFRSRDSTPAWYGAGAHGYDNEEDDMHTIFMARWDCKWACVQRRYSNTDGVNSGPAFKQGYQYQGEMQNVDIYPLTCAILGLVPGPNNGSLTRVQELLN